MLTHSDEQELSEINVTPFIDIMLVLLIIFMVVAPLITSSVKVELPQSSSSAKSDENKLFILYINENELSLNDTKLALNELIPSLKAKSVQQDELIYLYIDKLVPYERLASIINELKNGGFHKIALATQIKNAP
ncbi:biopolymer transporter ExbD [Campylobacter sp. MIT 12-8780]|uniref:ExbD/TolR family protein n=1 Tax=unclassified Campylobacter TaxID=2593542 RepID=UPI00115F197B|nr:MULTISPECIES: biopolymer transporter ExbD [unclassified Campylobacter]NDJ26918.1 biopolymer transporter ExbD [Campylobacter sp. MIT 19-121]TQR41937.1 biopolymer transporter ExbD [Campylobacter sp. MIT 12-8780]